MLATSQLFAQDAIHSPNESASDVETERVIVTGSNIPTAAEVGPNPVQVIDRYTIEKSGERNTEELLRDTAVANANGVPTSGNAGTLYGEGASSASLHGFDPGSTLVLINGHRLASHPSGTTFGQQFFVDLNSIPRAAIESVEILTDGASTTYGEDAVAGVINIKLRHDYRGAEVNVEYGNTTSRDSGEVAASVVFGVGNDKTNLTGILNYYRRNSIFTRDRDYDRETPASRFTTDSSPYNLQVSRAAAEAAAGRPIAEVDQSLDTFFAHAPFLTNGGAPASTYAYSEGPSSASFPVNHYRGELPDTERSGAYLSADHKIFGEQMVAYADLFFERSDVLNEQEPVNTAPFQLSGSSTLAIPPHAPGPTLGGPSYADTGVTPGAYNPFNPFQQIISGTSSARLFEFGNRKFDSSTDTVFTTIGLRGDKLFGGSWGYDAAFRYSHIVATTDITYPSAARFERTLNAADPIFNPNSPQYVGTTVPFNPFGDYRVPIANNYKLVDFVVIHPREIDTSSLAVFDLNIYTTGLFQLPAGGVGLAFGAQVKGESLRQEPDASIIAGDLRPTGANFIIDGSQQSYAGYAETSIPIFGSNFSAPGLHALELTAAVRFEAFSEGSNVMVPKIGLRWQPFDDSLTMRATWGEGYRLPTLVEVEWPHFQFAQTTFDPVKKVFVPDLPTTLLPNPNLRPEDSRNFTAGIVYSPKFAPGLTVSIDLFNIETTGWVNPYQDATRSITRIESGHGFPGESVTRDANGNLIALAEVAFENSGTQKARGADLGISYERQTSIGTFRSTTQASFLDSFQFSSYPGIREQELRSSPTDQFSDDAYLKWKGTSRVDWEWRGLSASATARYRDGFHEFDVNGNEHWVRQTWFFDLQASYEFRASAGANFNNGWPTSRYLLDHTSITLGCTNIFDHDPPRSNDNFPRFIYDPTGRFIYVSLKKTF